MDKARTMKRQLKHTGELNSSNPDKEMDGEIREEDDEELGRRPSLRSKASSSTKKFKLPTKPFIDRNAVDHSIVPRKLRSAMNKRSRESLSPPLAHMKNHHNSSVGKEAARMSGLKRFKQNSKQEGQANQVDLAPITKDEEEVAQALFSLHTVLPEEKAVENKVDQRSSDDKSSLLQDSRESPQLVSQAVEAEEKTQMQLTSSAPEPTILSSNSEHSSKQDPSSGLPIMGRPVGYGNNKFDLDLGSSTALADLLRTSFPARNANGDIIPLADPSELGVSPEFCNVTGPVQLSPHEVSLRKQKLEYGQWPVLHPTEKDNKDAQKPVSGLKGNGALLACIEGAPYLWPGMYRVQPCGGEAHGPSSWSSSNKLPAWLESAAPPTKTGSSETSVLNEKVKPVNVDQKKSWKRCATHVYISRLIQAYQTAEKKPRWPVPPSQLKPNERTRLGVPSTNGMIGLGTGLSGNVSGDGTYTLNGILPHGKNPSELHIGNLQEKKFQREQQMSISPSGNYSSEKDTVVSSAQAQLAYLHSISQHHPLMSFPLSHVRPGASQAQTTQYASNQFYFPSHSGHAVGPTKQQLEQQQQHQAWAAQVASQYNRPGLVSISGTSLPRWQNGVHDPPSLIPCAQPSFSSPLELLSSRGSQQKQLFDISSIGKREHVSVPHTYTEGAGGGLQPDASTRLQLVCSTEHT